MSLPAALGAGELIAWRLDQANFASAWDAGEGAYRAGGRWNSRGVRAVYCSIDPSTAILEVAVHKGFKALDTVAHILTAAVIAQPSDVFVVEALSVPNANWLTPGLPSAGQQEYGDHLIGSHKFVLIPSAVSRHSWNLIFVGANTVGDYSVRLQEPFALDTRLHPPEPSGSRP
jgi:RES domain-containing protein